VDRTHPLPRGGTDFMGLHLEGRRLSHSERVNSSLLRDADRQQPDRGVERGINLH
jgi:hypothetical protein